MSNKAIENVSFVPFIIGMCVTGGGSLLSIVEVIARLGGNIEVFLLPVTLSAVGVGLAGVGFGLLCEAKNFKFGTSLLNVLAGRKTRKQWVLNKNINENMALSYSEAHKKHLKKRKKLAFKIDQLLENANSSLNGKRLIFNMNTGELSVAKDSIPPEELLSEGESLLLSTFRDSKAKALPSANSKVADHLSAPLQ